MHELRPEDAIIIHNIIFQSGEQVLIEQYQSALKSESEMREGMYVSNAGWHGTVLPENIQHELHNHFGIEALYQRNVLSIDGTYIELGVLAGALPDNIISSYFFFDPEQRAKKAGVDFEQVKKDLKSVFKGTVGEPGKPSFGIILDEKVIDHILEFHAVLGLGKLRHPYNKKTIDGLKQKGDLSENFKTAVRQAEEVYDQNLDADHVYVVTAKDGKIALKVASEMLGLPKP